MIDENFMDGYDSIEDAANGWVYGNELTADQVKAQANQLNAIRKNPSNPSNIREDADKGIKVLIAELCRIDPVYAKRQEEKRQKAEAKGEGKHLSEVPPALDTSDLGIPPSGVQEKPKTEEERSQRIQNLQQQMNNITGVQQ